VSVPADSSEGMSMDAVLAFHAETEPQSKNDPHSYLFIAHGQRALKQFLIEGKRHCTRTPCLKGITQGFSRRSPERCSLARRQRHHMIVIPAGPGYGSQLAFGKYLGSQGRASGSGAASSSEIQREAGSGVCWCLRMSYSSQVVERRRTPQAQRRRRRRPGAGDG